MSTAAVIRPYRPADEQAVRDICWATGALGEPADRWVDMNRALFTDLWLDYYLRVTPELVLVAEVDDHIVGYATACVDTGARERWQARVFRPQFLRGLLSRRYRLGRRTLAMLLRLLHDTVRHGGMPEIPDRKACAHMHYNVLPGFRSARDRVGPRLMFAAFALLRARGATRLANWVVLRPDELHHRYGTIGTLHDRRRTTLYTPVTPEPLFLATILVDLQTVAKRHGAHGTRWGETVIPPAKQQEIGR